VALLIPVYQNQIGLNRSLESLREAEGRFHIFIVDDGSPQPIIVPDQLRDDLPITLIRLTTNRGIAGALNHGLKQILRGSYDYVARLDSGDTVAADRFDRQAKFLDNNTRVAVVSSFVDFVDSQHRFLFRYRAPSRHREIVRQMHITSCVMHPGCMIRASALKVDGLYREDTPGAEDYELFLRLSKRFELAIIPEVLTRCEYSPNGISIAGRRRQQRQRLKLQLRYFDPQTPYSYFGVVRTLVAFALPKNTVLQFKRLCFR
ncbi:MAG TPA: glycosyltransferase, partial [Bryobacteraceae bacterium]|nr:glycosyltransferase [Bryobacteraceae bacterium]